MPAPILTSAITHHLEQAGILDHATEFSCCHSRGHEEDPRQHVIVIIKLAGEPQIGFTVSWASDGEVILWRFPNRPPDWIDDHSRIFTGQVFSELQGIEEMVQESIPRIRWMLHFYAAEAPELADGLVIALWSNRHLASLDPRLCGVPPHPDTSRSKIRTMTAMIQQAGLLDAAEHYRCHAWREKGPPLTPWGSIDLAMYGPSQAHLMFVFSSDGSLELWATPNCESTYRYMRIFSGRCEPAEVEPTLQTLLPRIGQTLDLYASSNPMQDYGPLLRIWAAAIPTLEDPWSISPRGQEYLASKPPWWKAWR